MLLGMGRIEALGWDSAKVKALMNKKGGEKLDLEAHRVWRMRVRVRWQYYMVYGL